MRCGKNTDGYNFGAIIDREQQFLVMVMDIGWGVRDITFVDNGRVSYSNPARQVNYTSQKRHIGYVI